MLLMIFIKLKKKNYHKKKVYFFEKKGIFTQNFLKSKVTFFCYCIKVILWKFKEDCLKNVGGDRL